jgi:hypothetical protein
MKHNAVATAGMKTFAVQSCSNSEKQDNIFV